MALEPSDYGLKTIMYHDDANKWQSEDLVKPYSVDVWSFQQKEIPFIQARQAKMWLKVTRDNRGKYKILAETIVVVAFFSICMETSSPPT